MTEERTAVGTHLSGALIGWKRRNARHGVVLTLQVVENAPQFRDHQYHRVVMALNDRQLRSMARDLARAAEARGIDLRPRLPIHRRVWRGLKGLVA